MKNVAKIHRGFMTLSLLILLSSLLLILLLFDDGDLSLHSGLVTQRQRYVTENKILQQQFHQQKSTICSTLDLKLPDNVSKATFSLGTLKNQQEMNHFLWCQRQALFKLAPTKNINERQFSQFIAQEFKPLFRERFIQNTDYFPKGRDNHLFWFESNQNHWEIKGNINGIVIAEGDLTISGKGKISGAVITQGALLAENSVSITYSKARVADLFKSYSRWQPVEKTWYDFSP